MPGLPLLFVWDNLGPTHDDRLRAAAAAGFDVTAIQFNHASDTYSWEAEVAVDYRVVTLNAAGESPSFAAQVWRLFQAVRRHPARHVFLCHYGLPTMTCAILLRLFTGKRLFAMMNSKFDDLPRVLRREVVKSLFLRPYHGAMTSSLRSREYLAFLGVDRARMVFGYNTIDTKRLREHVAATLPQVPPFEQRDFIIVARLVPKKNIAAALEAFAEFNRRYPGARRLRILGDGPLEAELRAQADRLGIADLVEFAGFLQTREVGQAMACSLALILPSVEEQFGFVINEALALGLPVICTVNAGASDILVDNLVNGVLINPHDPRTIAAGMELMHADPEKHARMSQAALASADRGDTQLFAKGLRDLVEARES